MKKTLIFVLVLMMASVSFARTPTTGNMWNVSDYDGVYGLELDTSGNLLPMTDDTNDLGSSSYEFRNAYIDGTANIDTASVDALTVNTSISVPELTANVDTWDNLPAKSSVCWAVTTVATGTFVSNKYVFGESALTQISFAPRSIKVQIDGATASSATISIDGLDARGNRILETGIVHSEIFETAKCFSHVYGTTITVTVGGDASFVIDMGSGDHIGFMGDIDATTDMYKAVVQTSTTKADETSSLTVNATYDWWLHSDVPDGADDYYIFYRANSE